MHCHRNQARRARQSKRARIKFSLASACPMPTNGARRPPDGRWIAPPDASPPRHLTRRFTPMPTGDRRKVDLRPARKAHGGLRDLTTNNLCANARSRQDQNAGSFEKRGLGSVFSVLIYRPVLWGGIVWLSFGKLLHRRIGAFRESFAFWAAFRRIFRRVFKVPGNQHVCRHAKKPDHKQQKGRACPRDDRADRELKKLRKRQDRQRHAYAHDRDRKRRHLVFDELFEPPEQEGAGIVSHSKRRFYLRQIKGRMRARENRCSR